MQELNEQSLALLTAELEEYVSKDGNIIDPSQKDADDADALEVTKMY